MAPVSPRAKSTYVWPSRSLTRAPRARSRYSGKPPDHLTIQVIGTPPNNEPCAAANAAALRGLAVTNVSRSRARTAVSRSRSRGAMAERSRLGKTNGLSRTIGLIRKSDKVATFEK